MKVTPIRAPLPGERLAAIEPALSPDVRDYWNRRLNLYAGRALSHVALGMEQRTRGGRLATYGQHLTAGIVSGLEVGFEREDSARRARHFYRVGAGLGVTAAGEDVVVPQAARVNVLDVQVCAPAITFESGGAPDAAPQDSYATTLLPREIGTSLGALLKARHDAGRTDDETLPRVGVVLLQPVVTDLVGEADATDPCEEDPDNYAFEDWQTIDGCRLVYYPWPFEWRPLPRPDRLRRNRIARTIFDAEQALGVDELLPWEPFGVPLGLVAFNRRWKPLWFDRNAVARAGGKHRRRTSAFPGGGNASLWQARVQQFAEQVADVDSPTTSGAELATHFRYLPPVGLLPLKAAEPRAGRGHFFPSAFRVEAVPVPVEQLDAALTESAPLAAYDTFVGDEVQILVPVPQPWYEPQLLRVEAVSPEFEAAIDAADRRRAKLLRRREEVRGRADALDTVRGARPTRWPIPDPAALDPAEDVAEDPLDADDPFLRDAEALYGVDALEADVRDGAGNVVARDGDVRTVSERLPIVKDGRLQTAAGPAPLLLTSSNDLLLQPPHPSVPKLTALRTHLATSTPVMRTYTQVLTAPDTGLPITTLVQTKLAGLDPSSADHAAWTELAGRIEYDTAAKVLRWRGPMSADHYDRLTSLGVSTVQRDALTALLAQSQQDDLARLDELGIRGWTDMLEQKVNRADDRIDTSFLRVHTDIYRMRQHMLGASNATRLATSPVLASIAQGESALATHDNLSKFVSELKEQPTHELPTATSYLPNVGTRQPRTTTPALAAAAPAAAAAEAPLPAEAEPAPTSPMIGAAVGGVLGTSMALTSFTLPPGTRPGSGTGPGTSLTVENIGIRSPSGSLLTTSAFEATRNGGVTLPEGTAIAQPITRALTTAELLRAQAGTRPPSLAIDPTKRTEVVAQAPIIGKALNFRTVTVAERIAEPKAPETKNYAVATKADLLALLRDLELNFDDIAVPGFYTYKSDTGELDADVQYNDPNLPVEQRRVVRVVPKERTHTGLEVRTFGLDAEVVRGQHDLDPPNGDESAFFAAGVRALDNGVAFLRLLEGRIQAYRAVIEHCRTVVAELEALRASAGARLGVLDAELAETRHDLSVARALRAEETARVQRVNRRRDTILREHVDFLAYRRPRLVDLRSETPTRQLEPGVVEAPLPAALAHPVELPQELHTMVDLLREVPVRWFPYVTPLLDRLDRLDLMHEAIRYAKVRAAVQYQTRLQIQTAPPQAAGLGASIRRLYGAGQDLVAQQRVRTAQFDLAALVDQPWRTARRHAEEVLSLGDLLDGMHGRGDVVRRGAEELSNIGHVAGYLYVRFGEVTASIRLEWAEQLSEHDGPVTLRNLASLPRWAEIEHLERREMQGAVDWLFGRVDPAQTEAVKLVNDLVRAALLLASHAPVNQIVAGAVRETTSVHEGARVELGAAELSKVHVGMQVLIYDHSEPASPKVLARAVVEDLGAGRAAARVVHTAQPAVSLPAAAKAQFVEPDHPALAVATEHLEGTKARGETAVKRPAGGRFGAPDRLVR